MTLSPQVSSKLKLWLKSLGAKDGLILKKVHMCVTKAIEYPRSSLAWWEARSKVKRGFLRNGFLSGYMDAIDLVRYLMSFISSRILPVIIDYTDIDPVKGYPWRKILFASIPTRKGRAIPVEADVLTSKDIDEVKEDSENRFEKSFIMKLLRVAKAFMKRLLVICDRGYADGKMFNFFKKKGISFVVRVPCNVEIELPNGEWIALRDLLSHPSDKVLFLEKVRYSKEHGVRLNIVALWKRGHDEPWFIATDLNSPTEALTYYKKRFLVEQTFKSTKTYEGLECLKATNKAVLRGMIKAIFLACAFLILAGMAIEPFIPFLIPSISKYQNRYSIFTQSLLCLDRLRGGYAKCLCPKNFRALLNENLFLGGESM